MGREINCPGTRQPESADILSPSPGGRAEYFEEVVPVQRMVMRLVSGVQ